MATDEFMRTARLVLRRLERRDVEVVTEYRNDAEVARYQDWELPYPRERSERLVERMASAEWASAGGSLQIAVEHEGRLVGDVYVGWDDSGKRTSIGYTFAREHQGRGFAVEAVGAVVDRLMADGVQRIDASLDPENLASMRLLERLGFVLEARLTGAVLIRGQWVDDVQFGLTPSLYREWVDRPRTVPASVELVEITSDTSHLYRNAVTHPSQERFVSPTAKSYEHALFPEQDDEGGTLVPWMRGIRADGEAVGFVMLAAATATLPDPYLWRLVVDRRHQNRGVGSAVLRMLIDQLRADGHRRLLVSWVPGRGSPEPFYRRLGFVPNGKIERDEVEATLEL